jgi:hypothetical protein
MSGALRQLPAWTDSGAPKIRCQLGVPGSGLAPHLPADQRRQTLAAPTMLIDKP